MKNNWLTFLVLFFSIGAFHFLMPPLLKGDEFTIAVDTTQIGWRGWVTLLVTLGSLLTMIKEVYSPDIVLFAASGLFTLLGIIDPQEFLQGFSQDILCTIAMMSVVARSFEMNGLLRWLTQVGLADWKPTSFGFLALLLPIAILSIFLNNTPIVLVLTPILSQWALDAKMKPSKVLMPLSFATMLGGMCSLIGSSSNLLVDGLMRSVCPEAGLHFFELGYVGVPLLIVGLLYISFIGRHLLPERDDPLSKMKGEAKEFTAEFVVKEKSPLIGLLLKEAGQKFFRGCLLIEIEREGRAIASPDPEEAILPNDRLIFIGDGGQIASLNTIEGLKPASDPHFQMDPDSLHFFEIIISNTSSFIGKTLKEMDFRSTYQATVIAIYRQGYRLRGDLGEHLLHPGDNLVLLSSEEWPSTINSDFYCFREAEKVSPLRPTKVKRLFFVCLSMASMLLATGQIMTTALLGAFLMCSLKCISLKQAQQTINWSLLLMIGSSFAFGIALEKTQIAHFAAKGLLSFIGTNPHLLIASIFLITLVSTSFITNAAAAVLVFPIAVRASLMAGFDPTHAIKALGVTVAIAASCDFITPIGYQTNLIVYGQGGYKFTDFTKMGLPLTLLCWGMSTVLINFLWPL
jgi:di/tricarboxylate transporter